MEIKSMLNKESYEVLVTGGSRGIGKAIVSVYESFGYNVYAPGRNELDLFSLESVNHFVQKHSERMFLIVINNAGCNYINPIESLDVNDVSKMVNINMLSPLYLIKGFVQQMKKNSFGRIVNIGSIWGVISKPGRVGYSMTKHGLHGITTTLALELARDNILVNTVAPGQTMTDLTRQNNSDEDIYKMSKDIPLGRLASPLEIAKAVYYLGSEDNTYITGQMLVVDGGLSVQ